MSQPQVSTARRDLDIQRLFWNQWAADCKKDLDSTTLRHGETVLGLLKGLCLSRPDILEVGCANGWLSAGLANLGQVTGTDLADAAIAVAQSKYPSIRFIAGDFLNMNLGTDCFDVVVSVGVISCVEDQRRFVSRISELLKSHGFLILTCPNKFIWDRTDFVRRSQGEIPLDWLNMGGLKELLRNQFDVLHSETIIPAGNRGILRLINSRRLNALIQTIVPEPSIVQLKEKIGLGKTLVILAQKRM
jgi:2-polyprenyl-3-methyl-5-hydroxy-6-metoxy-1,4-benzoquinol methylase